MRSALIAAVVALGAVLSTGTPGTAAQPVPVVVSIKPLADFTRAVGGERVAVTVLVPPGRSPHAYTLRPGQMIAVSRARLLVLNGLGLEFFAEGVIAAADNPELAVVRAAEGPVDGVGAETPAAADDGDPGAHARGAEGLNPHVWLDPLLAKVQVQRIRDALLRVDPEGREVYERGAADYLARLDALHRDYERVLGAVTHRELFVFHAAYTHLARRYGLEEVALVPGEAPPEPTSRRMAELIGTIRETGARTIFVEPQLSDRIVGAIARETGVAVGTLDPLGRPGEDYLAMMRENLRQLEEGLR